MFSKFANICGNNLLNFAEIGCMYAATLGCMYAPFGCMYAEAVGCMYAVVGCMADSR